MSSRVVRSVGIVVAAGALTLGGVACADESDNGGGGGDATEVTLAFVGAQTGPNRQLGINISNGAQIAIDEYNAEDPEVKVSLKMYDTQGAEDQGGPQADKVIADISSDNVVGVIGPAFSGESKNAIPKFNQAKLPNISASATATTLPELGGEYWHRVLANDAVQGPAVATFMADTLGAQKVMVVDDQSEYGTGLADNVIATLEDKGVEHDTSSLNPDAADYASTVNAARSADPDVVYFAGYYSDAAKLVKQMRDSGMDQRFVSSDGSLDQELVKGAKDAAEGALLSCTCSWAVGSDDPKVQAFAKTYKTEYGYDPATYSSEGYDAARAFLMAIGEGNTDPESINEYLKTVDFQGVSKQIKFEDTGELASKDVFIDEVVDGKIQLLGPADSAKPTTP